MKFNGFYFMWGAARAALVVAFVLINVFLCVKSHCFNLEMEYRGPGSEIERFERQVRDDENREAAERCDKGKGSEKDQEKANEYYKDHSA